MFIGGSGDRGIYTVRIYRVNVVTTAAIQVVVACNACDQNIVSGVT